MFNSRSLWRLTGGLFLFGLSTGMSSAQETFQPGVSYFGRENYIEYQAGNLPIILVASHGGLLTPAEIPDRTVGSSALDTNTRPLTEAMAQEIFQRTGKYPHVIISHLRRSKLDPNREIVEAAQGNQFAEIAWHEFHGFIRTARAAAEAEFGFGALFDIHGHGHDIQRIELGYGLGAPVLNLSDDQLQMPGYGWNSSLRTLMLQRPGHSFPSLLRGPRSLGSLLNDRGVPAWPSAEFPSPGNEPFWSGGYITLEHTCMVDNGVIHGVQLEMHWNGLRDTVANRTAFAANFARVLQTYLWDNYGYSLGTLSHYRLNASTNTIAKGGSMVILTVQRGGLTNFSATLGLEFGGTAVPGVDYVASASSLNLSANQASASFVIAPTAPNGDLGDKTIEVRLAPTVRQTADLTPVILTLGDGVSQAIRVQAVTPEVDEGERFGLFTLRRTQTTGDLAVNLQWSGTAIPGVDYDFPWELPSSITFPAGVAAVDIPVRIVDDAIPEIDKNIILGVAPGPNYIAGHPNQASILIRDDDKADGLQVWLRGDLTDHQLLDSSGHGRHATGLPAGLGPISVPTAFGPAFRFDGAGAVAGLPRFPASSEKGFTVAFHFRIPSSANTDQTLLSFGNRGGQGSLNIYLTSTTNLRTWLRSPAGNESANALDVTANWMNGTWRHYAITVDETGTARLYINGNLLRSVSAGLPGLDQNEIFWLGWRRQSGAGGDFLNGELRDFRVYDRALAPSEVADAAGANRLTFDAWSRFHALPAGAGADADLSGDGLPLLLEYGLGASPHHAALPPRYRLAADQDRMSLAFLRQTNARDLIWRVQATNDLGLSWETIAQLPANSSTWTFSPGVTVLEQNGLVTIRDNTPFSSTPGRFLRLRVSLQP